MHSKTKQYKLRRAALIIRLGCECVGCGSSRDLQFHHIDGNGESGDGGWNRMIKLEREIKRQERTGKITIELRCKYCHQAEHERLGLDPIEGGAVLELS